MFRPETMVVKISGDPAKMEMIMNTRRRQARKLKQKGLTYAQIGERMGITRQRAQQLVTIPKPELEKLRAAANGKCQKCGKTSKKLDGHHENYNSDKLIMVCVSCHMRQGAKSNGKNYCIRSQGKMNEQVEFLCKTWGVDASKAIRKAVADASESWGIYESKTREKGTSK